MTLKISSAGVLLLAYGSPHTLEDIPAYLRSIRGGREPSRELIETITDRYQAIGGQSPLLEITRSLAHKLEPKLTIPVYIGMRHWTPTIKDAVKQMVSDGVRHMIAVCLAPHYSALSVGAYRQSLNQALDAQEQQVTLNFIPHWHTQENFLSGLTENTRAALERFHGQGRTGVRVLFTAHSLPISRLPEDDPYRAQLQETAEELADRLALRSDRWQLVYQSAAREDPSWLGPHLNQFLRETEANHLLLVPIGFLMDHLEVLYDLDIEAQEIAQDRGIELKRVAMLNDSPALEQALLHIIQNNLT